MVRSATGRAAVLMAAAALTACTSSAARPAGPSGSSTSPGRSSSPTGQSLVATDAQNHRTLLAHVGDRLRVQLGSTYWQFGPPSGVPLRPAGRPSSASSGSCVPGGGCGFVVQVYDVVQPGTAYVTASRTSCGEARRCLPGERSYRLTVIVRG
jgi:hypothetical protein